ncbi:hypothetical protein [Arthrobacter bambusae]|uniref:hypothetical protein n=1 Tax=Arthrobacter bambusae TaxID=1338426 RepID=UPI0027817510|nr:hypothetical protein [Arthrobacter bambusae]MDQ0030885.1 hypothetical protein [Arthrobacter bambusae]MDQ0099250.1 hypothetical protein [Arthrobacter bambusae]
MLVGEQVVEGSILVLLDALRPLWIDLHVMNGGQNPKIADQHYVSRALLSRFSKDPNLKNGLVGQFDVAHGKELPARSP